MADITYTPDGIPRQPGYYDPNNPYDTGRTGERNAEKGGGGKNTMPGWDYDAGRPKPGAFQDANGVWQLPGGGGGGGGGGGFPGAALIAQQLAYAKKAYEQALARITNQRQTLSRSAGFTFDVDPETGVLRSMRVDPQSLYGTFQMLNRQQADRDEAARASAIERGLGSGGGLAAQLRADAKYQSGEEDARFSSSLIDTISQLALQQQEAKNAYDMAKVQAELEMARMAQPSGGGGGYYPDGGEPDPFMNQQNPAILSEWAKAAAAQNAAMARAKPVQKPAPSYTNKAVQAMGQRYQAMARAYGR